MWRGDIQQGREAKLQVVLRGAMGRCGGLHQAGTSGTGGREEVRFWNLTPSFHTGYELEA